jgi:hypothetical protein
MRNFSDVSRNVSTSSREIFFAKGFVGERDVLDPIRVEQTTNKCRRWVNFERGLLKRSPRKRWSGSGRHKDLTCLAIDCSYTDLVAQVLMAAPALTSIVCNVYGYDGGSIKQSFTLVLLKHAATLEHLNMKGRNFDNEIIRAILLSYPRLKTIKTMEPVEDYGPVDEMEIDAQRAFESPLGLGGA